MAEAAAAEEKKVVDDGKKEELSAHQMDLYSRAIAALGLDTMRNLGQLSVLIIGQRGVGVETAKNLILSGPKNVTLYDKGMTEIADLGANFYLRKEHVGKVTRAEATHPSLKELNPYCDVKVYDGKLSKSFIQSFGAVVVTETLSRAELQRINRICRNRKIEEKPAPVVYILAVTHGVSSHFFSDFGDAHLITDADGEPTRTFVVKEWRTDSEGKIRIKVAAKRHGFDNNQAINFEDIEAGETSADQVPLSVLNGAQGMKIQRIYREYQSQKDDGSYETRRKQVFDEFELDLTETKDKDGNAIDVAKLGPWKTGGILTEIKAKQVMAFKPLAQSFVNPCQGWMQEMFGPAHPDQGAMEKGAGKTVHLLYVAALEFRQKHGRFMRLHDEDDAREFKKVFESVNKARKEMKEEEKALTVETVDELRVMSYSRFFPCELTGYCAFLGGIAAQEVVKKFGKYTPVHQWFHCDHIQFVGEGVPSDAIPQNSRFDHQISIFGKSFQQRIANQKIFLVGCGALGCEYLKGIAMMGACSGPNGKLWCTDMDRIEVSNLSRQFLFRATHVGKQKSVISSSVAKSMNPGLNVEALEMKVWPETEDFFDDKFWDGLDLCWNALDNVMARKYTDSKCLFHGKPLLESGTMGTKCNSEVIIPFKTKSYNDGEEQETEGIPMCTLQNFPYLPIHCIEWARSSFSGLFETTPKTYNTFVSDREKFFEQVDSAGGKEKLAILENVNAFSAVQLGGKPCFTDCIRLAFNEFTLQHCTRIMNLIHWFPEDHKTSEGKNFWAGNKRFPQVPKLDLKNPLILDYLHSSANLFAFAFDLEGIRDKDAFAKAAEAAKLVLPEWKPPTGPKAKTDEDDDDGKEAPNAQLDGKIDDLIEILKKVDSKKLSALKETEFEKDDDKNFHIDYITAACNIRAWNYRIKEQSRHDVKIKAGKIIAALATTTAMITGLVELEFYKLLLGLAYVHENAFYNANFNLSVPTQFQFFQPESAIRATKKQVHDEVTMTQETHVPYPPNFTSWDKLVINEGNLTIQEFADIFPDRFFGVQVKLLHKLGKMKEGTVLYSKTASFRSTRMEETLLKRDGLSDARKKQLQATVDAAKKRNDAIRKKQEEYKQVKLVDRYIELYGPLVSEKRNHVELAGDFEDADGNVAILPVIKYVFK